MLFNLWGMLGARRKAQFVLLLGLMLFSSLTEVISLGSVLPFIGVLISPESVFNSAWIRACAPAWGITSGKDLVLPITLAFALLAILAGATRIVLIWLSTKLAFACGAEISIEAYKRTLYQNYQVHVSRNSSEIISGVINKVGAVVHGVLVPFPTMISSFILLFGTCVALIWISPEMALASITGFGSCYLVVAFKFRDRLRRNSDEISQRQEQAIKALQEGLGGVRDVLLDGTQQFYCDYFSKADKALRDAQSNTVFIGISPRYLMEAIGIVIISFIAYWLVCINGDVTMAVPMLAALAMGAQRMLPALQQGYGSWVSIASSESAIRDTLALLSQPMPKYAECSRDQSKLNFESGISVEALSFRYLNRDKWVLRDMTFHIQKGMRIGIVGGTGSGKSTLADLLMGLLLPTEGKVVVDGKNLDSDNVRAWQNTIAHVPQAIFLADASIAENIAFGIASNLIDMERVRSAATKAQLSEFITELPEGYGTQIGERGIRLSGGQRQRIGIARALYKNAQVLVFDEATSALDTVTEMAVMNSLAELSKDWTIIVIAHRLSTVRACNKIYEVSEGRIINSGTFDQLYQSSRSFKLAADSSAGYRQDMLDVSKKIILENSENEHRFVRSRVN